MDLLNTFYRQRYNSYMINQNVENLTKGSLKKINLICDYCCSEYQQIYRNVIKGHKIINKDACPNKECRTKKRKESCRKKYGVDIATKSVEIKSKSSKTKGGSGNCVESYKDEIISLYNSEPNISVLEISKRFNLGRTSLIYAMKEWGLDTTGNIQEKTKKTNKERYGEEYYLKTEEGKKKLKETIKNRYGDENIYNTDKGNEILETRKNTCLEKYGVENSLLIPKNLESNEKKRQQKRIDSGKVYYKGKTVKEWAKDKEMAVSSVYGRIQKYGTGALDKEKNRSELESLFANFLDDYNIKYKTEVQIENSRCDFLIDKLIVELDGFYWHSDAVIKNDNYHQEKRLLYIDNGYTPTFFRQNELYADKFDIVKSIVLNKLSKSTKIHARKCNIYGVDNKIANKFLKENHLMGQGQGKSIGLFYENELVSIMQIKRTKDKNYDISRFCHKKFYSVIGGFSKLVKYIENNIDINSLSTFIDLRYGSGNYLENFDFKHISTNISFGWTDGRIIYHRMKFPGNSGYKEGFFKIWDCGQSRYSKFFSE